MTTVYRAAGISSSEDELDNYSPQPSTSYRRTIPVLNNNNTKKKSNQSMLPLLSNRTELYIPSECIKVENSMFGKLSLI